MGETRRAAVILIQRGDPEISAAIAEGLLAGKARAAAEAVPVHLEGETGEPWEQIEVVSAEADRRRTVARLVKIAVGNDKTPEDYRHMIVKARGDYVFRPYSRLGGTLLLAWAMICQGIRRAYRAQDRVLK